MNIEILPTMYKNYEKRVKNFIIEMNDPETKVEIKNYEGRINNPKTDLSKEKEIQKPFIFKGYTTEEDRIKDAIKRNRYLFNLPDYEDEVSNNNKNEKTEINNQPNINFFNKQENNKFKKVNKKAILNRKSLITKAEENKYKYILKNDLIIQPEMRFKPRTDLERVYDMINGYKYGLARRDILDKQLKNMGLYKYKNSNELKRQIKKEIKIDNSSSESEDDNNNANLNAESQTGRLNEHKNSRLYFNPKSVDYKIKPWMKRTDLNADAYKILNSYHYKTHFKAAKEVAENKVEMNKNKNKKNKYCLLLPNLFQNKSTNNFEILNSTYDNTNKNDELIFQLNEEIEDMSKIKYDKNKNPFKKKEKFEEKKIKLLGDIAFKPNLPQNSVRNEDIEDFLDENKIFDKNVDEDNIMVDNHIFNKKNQFELLTNKILDKCNVYNHKSKFNNTTLKKRNGKLMFTRGLSINQFEKKYGFK